MPLSRFMTLSPSLPTLGRLMNAREDRDSSVAPGWGPDPTREIRGERAILVGILALAAAVRLLRWEAVAVMFNDGPVFLALAQAIADGSAEQALSHPFHPLYSALIALTQPLFGSWENAGVFVSITCGTLAVGVLFAFVKRAHGSASALVAAALLAVHPGAIEYTGDIQSEGAYLLMLLLGALALYRGVLERRAGLGLLGGVAAGLAYLARPEGLGVAIAAGALTLFEALRGRMPWARAIALGSAIAVGASLVAMPYMVFLRVQHGEWTLTQKKSMKVMTGMEVAPRDGPDPILPEISRAGRTAERRVEQKQIPGHPTEPKPSEPKRTRKEKAYEGVFDTFRTHLRSIRYEGVAFLLLGGFLLGVRPVGFRGRFIGAVVGLYAVVLLALAANFGYVSGRHALPALTLTFGYVADGIWAVAQRLTQTRADRFRPLVAAAFVMIFVGVGLGKALRPDRADSAAERLAAEWLAAEGIEIRGLAARKRRIAYYAEAPHVKIHKHTREAERLWHHGASHLILSGDPDHYPDLRDGIESEANALYHIAEPEPGATVYELPMPPRYNNPNYRRRKLGEDAK